MMKFLQRIGKSLMLPVACLPVCGILMGVGYILAPAAMAGEVAGFTAGGFAYTIGLFLIKAGGALIDNMPFLFAIGVAVGMSDDNNGTAGLAGLVSFLMITTLLSSGTIAGLTGKDANPAFGKINNQFIGILAGLIGAACYNRFKSVKLPDALSFFSGKRAVAIVTAIGSILASAVLFFIWPLVYSLLLLLAEAFPALEQLVQVFMHSLTDYLFRLVCIMHLTLYFGLTLQGSMTLVISGTTQVLSDRQVCT